MICSMTMRISLAALVIGMAIAIGPAAAAAQTIVDEWDSVKIPPPPELHKVTIDPKTTVLWSWASFAILAT